MAKFRLTDTSGAEYEVDAPDEHSAVAALKQATAKPAANPFEEYRQKPANPFAEYAPARESKPIHIGAPDGSVVEFPAGTSDDTIKAAMAKAYPAPQAAPAAAEPKGTLQTIREAVHAPTRILENGVFLGLGDRARAAMGSIIGDGSYGSNLKNEQGESEEFQRAHPVAAPVIEGVGGAIAPIGAAAAASKAAGLGTKMLYGAGAGGTIGGVQGAFGSKDWTDVGQTARDAGTGAAIGGVVGGAIPAAGKAIGAGYRAVTNAAGGSADGMSRAASRHLVNAMEADGPAAVRQRLQELGPDAMLADAGPALLGKAQGASLNSDEGRSVLQSALTRRNEGTNARIQEDVNRALGPAQGEDPQLVTDRIRRFREEQDARTYPAALDNSPPVKIAPIMSDLIDRISQTPVGSNEHKALTNLQAMLTKKVKEPVLDVNGDQVYDRLGHERWKDVPVSHDDASVLHKVKGELDNVIQYDAPGLGVPAGALSRQQAALKQMRFAINDALERQVPGYANANAASAALAKRMEAVDLGTQYLGNGKTTASPGRFAFEFEGLEPGEKIAFAKGSRGNIERVLGTKANDLQALRGELQGEGGWNTAKIATVHGQPAADELVNSVDRNLKFRDTHNKVVENSQTAQRQAAAGAMKPSEISANDIITPGGNWLGMGLTALKRGGAKAFNVATESSRLQTRNEIAHVLTEQGPARDARVQSIIDAINGRQANAAAAPQVGNTAALLTALAANSYAHSDPKRNRR